MKTPLPSLKYLPNDQPINTNIRYKHSSLPYEVRIVKPEIKQSSTAVTESSITLKIMQLGMRHVGEI